MSQPKQKAPKGGSKASTSSAAITDPRFRNIQTDPRFRLPSKKTTHVKLDKRFAHMLRDDDFSKKASVDRYGRKLPKDQGRKELERFYVVGDEDDEGKEGQDEEEDGEDGGVVVPDDESGEDDEIVLRELARADRNYDPARQGGFAESSSDESSDEELEEVDLEDVDAEDAPGRLEDDEIPMGDVSTRLAAVNLDWDNIKAADIMAVSSSFCPPGGRILNVSIYTSEYGRERMEREDIEGPAPELFTSTQTRANDERSAPPPPEPASSDNDDSDAASDSSEKIKAHVLANATTEHHETDTKALRNYQLSRLRYFYAVITCSNTETASQLYTEMDGREYLSSANFFDLRFIPDSVTFDDPVTDKPRDECLAVPQGYKPKEFVTEALRHSKVKLTWDEDDQGRKEIQKRAFSRQEIDENDLAAYVGGVSSEEESEEEEAVEHTDPGAPAPARSSKAEVARQKLRAALGLGDEPAPSRSKKKGREVDSDDEAGGMQVTFTAGISSEPAAKGSVFQNRPEDVKEETTREKYIRKERERKERRKEKAKSKKTEEDGSDAEDAPAAKAAASLAAKPKAADMAEDSENDDPFNDPFFTDPSAANATAKKATKAAQRAVFAAEEAASAAKKKKEREELELLMAGEGAEATGRGFDMAEIRKAEKEAAKKGKKKRSKDKQTKADGKAVAVADDFEVNAQDPRFKALFESHEFAIDPSNPRYSGTKGMKSLLEQGRKKKDRAAVEQGVDERESVSATQGKRRAEDDLDMLVNKIKRKRN